VPSSPHRGRCRLGRRRRGSGAPLGVLDTSSAPQRTAEHGAAAVASLRHYGRIPMRRSTGHAAPAPSSSLSTRGTAGRSESARSLNRTHRCEREHVRRPTRPCGSRPQSSVLCRLAIAHSLDCRIEDDGMVGPRAVAGHERRVGSSRGAEAALYGPRVEPLGVDNG
jgi:hypothetical protein